MLFFRNVERLHCYEIYGLSGAKEFVSGNEKIKCPTNLQCLCTLSFPVKDYGVTTEHEQQTPGKASLKWLLWASLAKETFRCVQSSVSVSLDPQIRYLKNNHYTYSHVSFSTTWSFKVYKNKAIRKMFGTNWIMQKITQKVVTSGSFKQILLW